jgi:hypothetical protein
VLLRYFLKCLKLSTARSLNFLQKKVKSPAEIKQRLGAVYGESSPLYSTVKEWAKQFCLGRESTEEDPRQGRPAEALTPETIALVQEEVLQDRRLKTKKYQQCVGFQKPRYFELYTTILV